MSFDVLQEKIIRMKNPTVVRCCLWVPRDSF